MAIFDLQNCAWTQVAKLEGLRFICGYCGDTVYSDVGLRLGLRNDGSGVRVGGVFICPSCKGPNCFDRNLAQTPGALPGSPIKHLPKQVDQVYEEARACIQANANTAAVMLLRKILMNIAVEETAQEGKAFVYYVDFLLENGLVPKKAKPWVDQIRKLGNKANHSIESHSRDEAEKVLSFVEMILKTNYEYLHGVYPSDQSIS